MGGEAPARIAHDGGVSELDRKSKIYVAGHRGLVGRAVVRCLEGAGFTDIVTRPRGSLDLCDRLAVDAFFEAERPRVVVLAAAKVGGILANDTYPADFIRDNLLIQTHVIDAAARWGVESLLFLGSSCIYPRLAPQPIREDALLTGPLEPTNAAYALAKIAGIEMCRAYARQHGLDAICAMPTNLYGPFDQFDPERSHVLPALMRKAHLAKVRGDRELVVWGSGKPRRELLHVDDLARACLVLLDHRSRTRPERDVRAGEVGPINVGTGDDVSIAELVATVARVVGFDGAIRYDTSKPDGTPRKLLDVSRMTALGFRPQISLEEGVRATYSWFLEHVAPSLSASGARA